MLVTVRYLVVKEEQEFVLEIEVKTKSCSTWCYWTSNTSGTPPRDAAKMVSTTTLRVSVGVLRIKLHLVFAPW